MATILKFSLDSIEEVKEAEESLYEKVKKSRFAKVKIKLFGTGENAHTEPVDFETLKKSADSAYDIPLIAELNPYRLNKDFGGHGTLTGKQFSFGFIKEAKDNPIIFEKDEKTGKIFITLYGLIWKKYFKNIVEILLDNDSQAEVSVELDVLNNDISENGKPIMKQFVLNAVTFLGKVTTAACKGAMAQLAFSDDDMSKFAEDKKNFLEGKFEEDIITILNSAEEAVDGNWRNPKNKLLAPILKASNKEELLNEAYLFFEDVEGEMNVLYPHHTIKNGELVLHTKGVQSAFNQLCKQNFADEKAKAHLVRHYKTLGLNETNFEDFGLTSEQFELYFSTEFGKEETMSEETKNLEEVVEGNEEVATDPIEENKEEIEEHISVEDQSNEEKMEDSLDQNTDTEENTEENVSTEEVVEEETPETEIQEEVVEEVNNETEESELTFEKLKEENEKLKKDNEAYMAKIEEMSDYEDLKNFKKETLEKEEKMAEAVEMANVMKSLEDKGVKMSDEIKTSLKEERQNFANTSAWANYVKAYVFDNCEFSNTEDGIIKFDVVDTIKENQNSDASTMSIWQSLKNKIN